MVIARSVTMALLMMGALLPTNVFGQSTAEIRGTVHDQSGGVVPGATVTGINELTGLERTTVTDSGGRFNLPRLPVGNYRVEVKVDGFRPYATAPFRLNVEDIRRDYGERRFKAYGLIGSRVYVLIHTPREGRVHVISLRRANKREVRLYENQAKDKTSSNGS